MEDKLLTEDDGLREEWGAGSGEEHEGGSSGGGDGLLGGEAAEESVFVSWRKSSSWSGVTATGGRDRAPMSFSEDDSSSRSKA